MNNLFRCKIGLIHNTSFMIKIDPLQTNVTCPNEMSHMSKTKIELVQSLERIISFPTLQKIMKLVHAQP